MKGVNGFFAHLLWDFIMKLFGMRIDHSHVRPGSPWQVIYSKPRTGWRGRWTAAILNNCADKGNSLKFSSGKSIRSIGTS